MWCAEELSNPKFMPEGWAVSKSSNEILSGHVFWPLNTRLCSHLPARRPTKFESSFRDKLSPSFFTLSSSPPFHDPPPAHATHSTGILRPKLQAHVLPESS